MKMDVYDRPVPVAVWPVKGWQGGPWSEGAWASEACSCLPEETDDTITKCGSELRVVSSLHFKFAF